VAATATGVGVEGAASTALPLRAALGAAVDAAAAAEAAAAEAAGAAVEAAGAGVAVDFAGISMCFSIILLYVYLFLSGLTHKINFFARKVVWMYKLIKIINSLFL
jgi:hypothetical protein